MKGRTSNTQRTNSGCSASGGAVSAAPSAASAPVARRHGGSCEVEGKAAKPSLARAMRKRADGGRISDDSRREVARLRNEGEQKSTAAGIQGGIGTILSLAPRTGGRVGHALGKGIGVLNLGAAADSYFGGQRARAEANRIERGEAEPGREDRKNGGSVKKDWIAGAIKKPGALHKSLGVPEGEKIPAKKLDKAAHSDNPTLAKRANLAKTLKSFHKG